MKYMHSPVMIFALAILVGACTPARTEPAVISPPVTNTPTLIVPTGTETTPPETETIPPTPASPPPVTGNNQAFTEYTSGPLWVHLFSPQDEAIVQTPQIFITGQAPEDTVISLNDDIFVVSADQSFNFPMNLDEGPNVLEFVASDLDGNEVTFILTVNYEQ